MWKVSCTDLCLVCIPTNFPGACFSLSDKDRSRVRSDERDLTPMRARQLQASSLSYRSIQHGMIDCIIAMTAVQGDVAADRAAGTQKIDLHATTTAISQDPWADFRPDLTGSDTFASLPPSEMTSDESAHLYLLYHIILRDDPFRSHL